MLHDGGDDAATLKYCPYAVTLLLLECLFLQIPGLILVKFGKKISEQKPKKIPVQNTT